MLLGTVAAGLIGLSLPKGDAPVVTLAAPGNTAKTLSSDVLPSVAPPRLTPPLRAARDRAAAPTPTPAPTVQPAPVAKPAPVEVVVRYVRPSYAGVVSPFGMRNGKMHKGIDFGAGYGADIRAVGAGIVTGSGYLGGEGGYGLITLIRHPNGAVTAYAHQSETHVQAGDAVTAGEVIGQVGSSGESTGPHLHFEVRIGGSQVDPLPWLRARGVSI